MDKVTVAVATLLIRLKANRESHRDLFLKAQEGYRIAVVEELERMLQDARDNKPIRRAVSLAEPQDHTEDYNTIIDMLEMMIEPEIEISRQEFQCYARDKWDWAAHVLALNTSYTN